MVNPVIIKNEQIEAVQDDIKNMTDQVVKAIQNKPDALTLMFEKQQGLMEEVKKKRPNNYYFHGKERFPFDRLFTILVCLEDEIAEVRKGIDWKYWKERLENGFYKNNSLVDEKMMTSEDYATIEQMKAGKIEYLQDELIDLWHFLIQGSIEVGLDPQKVLEKYLNKNKENHERQDGGY